jgi:hypothetical protein
MKIASRTSVLFAAALLATTFASVGSASAESIVRAIYQITLTDAASGTTLNTHRLSIRSWPQMGQCKGQSPSGASFHVRSVKGYGIHNSAGNALTVTGTATCPPIRSFTVHKKLGNRDCQVAFI